VSSNNEFKKRSRLMKPLAILAALIPMVGVTQELTWHSDYRSTAKLLINDQQPLIAKAPTASDEAQVRSYLSANAEQFGLHPELKYLSLVTIKPSLLANHYHFQQQIQGTAVDKAEIVVSVANSDNSIIRVYNSTHPISQVAEASVVEQLSKAHISASDALSKVWAYQPAKSKLLTEPGVRQVAINENGEFRLVYQVTMVVNELKGSWEYTLDVQKGEVIKLKRLNAPYKGAFSGPTAEQILNKGLAKQNIKRTSISYNKAFQEYRDKQAKSTVQVEGGAEADAIAKTASTGSAQVFDPDPRTTLNDADLHPTSPDSAFSAAYFTRTLQDITLSDFGIYSLEGPWISIVDWDEPSTAPSTTLDGNWTELRGNLAFYDAMTYFHIDQNQRYLQSLGFVGDKLIQGDGITADTNGVDEEDNAFFEPGANRLTFGSPVGCASNAEDADVILHEYGHALQDSIVMNWGGGDTGAIGEGFSDYWGAHTVMAL